MPSSSVAQESQLPVELVVDILLYASYTHTDTTNETEDFTALLVSCSRVSHIWGHVCRSFLYKQVTLTRPLAALRFIRTLNASPTCAALVTTLILWTSIYGQRGGVSQFPVWEKMSRTARARRRCDERFLDTVSRRCPNLTRLSVQNRSKANMPIWLPSIAGCKPTLLSQLRYLELDVYPVYQSSGAAVNLIEALVAGGLELPELERMVLIRPDVHGTSSSLDWRAPTPALRHLMIVNGSLRSSICHSILVTSPPALRELHLVAVMLHEYRLQLPSTLEVLFMHNCVIFATQLSHLVASCAPLLTDLELIANTSLKSDPTASQLPPWPAFERLRRLRLGWESIELFGLSLLQHVLLALPTLEVMRAPEPSLGTRGTSTSELERAGRSVLDVLASRAVALQSLTLRGNSSLDAAQLSLALRSMPRLRSFGIGTDIPQLTSDILLQLPTGLRRLQLCLEGFTAEAVVENYLLQRKSCSLEPSAPTIASDYLETIDVVSTATEWPRADQIRILTGQPPPPTAVLRNPEVLRKLGANLLIERIEPTSLSTMTPLDWVGALTPRREQDVAWYATVEKNWSRRQSSILASAYYLDNMENSFARRRKTIWWTMLSFLLLVLQPLVGMLYMTTWLATLLVVMPLWYVVVRPGSILLEWLVK